MGDSADKDVGVWLIAGDPHGDPADTVGLLADAFARLGLTRPSVAYVGTASDDDEQFFSYLVPVFGAAGASSVELARLASEDADVDRAWQTILAADAVFVSGGQPAEGMRWLARHGLSTRLRDLCLGGKPFIGLSAGSIMLGSHWFEPERPDAAHPAALVDCLGVVPMSFDAHGESEGWPDLRILAGLLGDPSAAVGLPAGSMVRATASGDLEPLAGVPMAYSDLVKR